MSWSFQTEGATRSYGEQRLCAPAGDWGAATRVSTVQRTLIWRHNPSWNKDHIPMKADTCRRLKGRTVRRQGE